MTDLRFIPDDNNIYDLNIVGDEFELDETAETHINMQILSDIRATDETIVANQLNKGCIGDLFYNVPLGSELWLIDNRRSTTNLALITDYVRKCLQDLINNNIVDTIEVTAEYILNGVKIYVTLTKDNQSSTTMEILNYDN